MRNRRLVRYGEWFTERELADGTAELEAVPPAYPGTAPPLHLQDEHWPGDWAGAPDDWGFVNDGDA